MVYLNNAGIYRGFSTKPRSQASILREQGLQATPNKNFYGEKLGGVTIEAVRRKTDEEIMNDYLSKWTTP